jgi:hypothetical protein
MFTRTIATTSDPRATIRVTRFIACSLLATLILSFTLPAHAETVKYGSTGGNQGGTLQSGIKATSNSGSTTGTAKTDAERIAALQKLLNELKAKQAELQKALEALKPGTPIGSEGSSNSGTGTTGGTTTGDPVRDKICKEIESSKDVTDALSSFCNKKTSSGSGGGATTDKLEVRPTTGGDTPKKNNESPNTVTNSSGRVCTMTASPKVVYRDKATPVVVDWKAGQSANNLRRVQTSKNGFRVTSPRGIQWWKKSTVTGTEPIPVNADTPLGVHTVTASVNVYQSEKIPVGMVIFAPGYQVVCKVTFEVRDSKIDAANSFSLSDIASVTSKYVDPNPRIADEEYTLYTITLKNGKKHMVKGCGRCTTAMREEAFRKVGYTGDVAKLIALAKDTTGDADTSSSTHATGDIFAKIELDDEFGERILNSGTGNLNQKVIFTDGTVVPFGEWFPLVKEGKQVTDSRSLASMGSTQRYNADGVLVRRIGGNKIQVLLDGNHRGETGSTTKNYEYIKARLVLSDGSFIKEPKELSLGALESNARLTVPGMVLSGDSAKLNSTKSSVQFEFIAEIAADGFEAQYQ